MVAVTMPEMNSFFPPPVPPSPARRLLAEFLGTGLLVRWSSAPGSPRSGSHPDDVGMQLLENSTATAFGLTVLILMFGPVSGAHFNPVVSRCGLVCRPVQPDGSERLPTLAGTPPPRSSAPSAGRC